MKSEGRIEERGDGESISSTKPSEERPSASGVIDLARKPTSELIQMAIKEHLIEQYQILRIRNEAFAKLLEGGLPDFGRLHRPHCLAFAGKDKAPLDKSAYERLVSTPQDYDLLIDGLTLRAWRRGNATECLTRREFDILRCYIVSGKPMRPTRAIHGLPWDSKDPGKLFTNARRKVDTRIGRRDWQFFKTIPHPGTGSENEYQFSPVATDTCFLILAVE